jgi:hypothetical protein
MQFGLEYRKTSPSMLFLAENACQSDSPALKPQELRSAVFGTWTLKPLKPRCGYPPVPNRQLFAALRIGAARGIVTCGRVRPARI